MVKKILFVDDDELMAEFAVMTMESGGFKVKHCISGKKALATVEQYSPDLILLDIQMPDMDGKQTLSELKKIESAKNIPVIFLTWSPNKKDAETYAKMGVIGVIGKPFDAKTLCQTIKKLCISKWMKILIKKVL